MKMGSRWYTEKQVAEMQKHMTPANASKLLLDKASKYFAQKTIIDNINFASKKEGRRYQELKALKFAKEVKFFLRQVPFHLPGKTKYLLDFMVFWENGNITFEDTKGFRTSTYKLKKRQVEEIYPIKILEI
jgi:hypothetical protein